MHAISMTFFDAREAQAWNRNRRSFGSGTAWQIGCRGSVGKTQMEEGVSLSAERRRRGREKGR